MFQTYIVTAGDGLNVRPLPSKSKAPVAALPTGYVFTWDRRQPDMLGNMWVRIAEGPYQGKWVCIIYEGSIYAKSHAGGNGNGNSNGNDGTNTTTKTTPPFDWKTVLPIAAIVLVVGLALVKKR